MAVKKETVLIVGGYSSNNKGDHAMLIGLLNWIGTLEVSTKPVVYTTNPDFLNKFIKEEIALSPEYYCFKFAGRAESPGAMNQFLVRLRVLLRGLKFYLGFFCYRITGRSFVRKKYCLEFYERLTTARAVFLSGGGYLNSLWWLAGGYAKLFPVLLAKHMKIPVILTGQGIGPFSHRLDKMVAGLIFKSADIIGLRDRDESIHELQDLGIDISHKVIHTGDDSMFLEAGTKEETDLIRRREGIAAGELLIAVNFRDSSSYAPDFAGPDFSGHAELLDMVLSKAGRRAVFVPISFNQADDDRRSAAKIMEKMTRQEQVTVVNSEYTPSQIKHLIGSMDLAIGTSYHFSLFALSSGVPAIGVYQDPYFRRKLEGLFSQFGMKEYCCNFLLHDKKTLHEAIESLIRKRNAVANALREKNKALAGTARASREQMAGILRGSS